MRPTPSPVPTATSAIGSIPKSEAGVERQLPRDVFEQFEKAFYRGCPKPAFEELKVFKSWSGADEGEVEFIPPGGTYYLALEGRPSGAKWHFDSILEGPSGKKLQSLHIDSSVPDELTDAQEWCSAGSGVLLPNTLYIDSSDMAWQLYLLTPDGTEGLPRAVAGALIGYFGACPPAPPIGELEATQVGTGGGCPYLHRVQRPIALLFLGSQV